MNISLLIKISRTRLPFRIGLPVNLLSACFNNTSATYKFYWFLAILQSLENGQIKIAKKDLFARMISNAWYTVNYFHISFGKQDRLQRAIEEVKKWEPLTIDDKRDKILNHLINTKNKKSLDQLKYFNNQVPHWFFLAHGFQNLIEMKSIKHLKNLKINACTL